MSIVLEDEKPVSVNEVPDYHEDIHMYLREMEVKALWIYALYYYLMWQNWEDNIFKFLIASDLLCHT